MEDEILESLRRDQEENKNLPDRLVIDGQEFTNIRVREISLEPEFGEKEKLEDDENNDFNQKLTDDDSEQVQSRDAQDEKDPNHDEIMKEIEESLRRDQEENSKLPEKIVIDGLEFSNIRVREISLEPELENEEPEQVLEPKVKSRSIAEPIEDDSKQVQSRDTQDEKESRHDEIMKEIEESLRRDQEENSKLPEKVVIDGLEFSNIRVREISLEPELNENEELEPEPKIEPKLEPVVKSRSIPTNISDKQPVKNMLSQPKPSADQTGEIKTRLSQPATERNTNLQQNTVQRPKAESTSQSSFPSKIVIASAICIVFAFLLSRLFKKS